MSQKKTKNKFKYEIGSFVRLDGLKAKVLDHWKDEANYKRYEVRFMVGKNEVGDSWMTLEKRLGPYTRKEK